MVSALISRVVILVFGTLYPAYSSYKAVKTKNVKEYVKWMMYWIVFALFTCVETFADVLISWFPFYYELKICFVIWLLSPATKGSSILYRKFVHPELLKREGEIDLTLEKVKTQGYSVLVNVGQQGLNMAVQGAMTGQARVLDHVMKKSWSVGDISRQPGNAAVTFNPSQEKIPEAVDETDYPSRSDPGTSYPCRGDPNLPMMPSSVSADHLSSQQYMSHQYSDMLPSRDISVVAEAPPTFSTSSESDTPYPVEVPNSTMTEEIMHEPVILSPRGAGSGYNLRDQPAHEYHSSTVHSAQLESEGLTHRNSSRPQYTHTQGHHYGTLPRRASSMRSKVNTALPSRWAKSNTQSST